MQYIVICTLGRSGSTLLQGILNAFEGCCVRGENNNFLLGIYEAYRSLKIANKIGSNALLPTHPWYGGNHLNPDKFLRDFVKIFNEQLAIPDGTRIAGFKEIRWLPSHLRKYSLTEYIYFLHDLLKNVKFVLLTRNSEDVYNSQIRAGFDLSGQDLQYFSMMAGNFYREMRSIDLPIFELDYSDIVNNSYKIPEMFDFLELRYDAEIVKSVLEFEHSYANSSRR